MLYAVQLTPRDGVPEVKLGFSRRHAGFPHGIALHYQMKFGNGVHCRCRWWVWGTKADEAAMHKRMKAHRIGGREWYAPDVLEYLPDSAMRRWE